MRYLVLLAALLVPVAATAQPAPGAPLVKSRNLGDLPSPSTARTNLGLGTIATQSASNVNITGGTIGGGDLSGANVTPYGGVAANIASLTATRAVPSNNNICFVGDSITFATEAQNTIGINASGGTAPYTFSLTGLPSGATATTSSPNLYFTQGTAALGTYTVSVTATDSASATGTRNYTLTASTSGISLVPAGSSTGSVTVNAPSIIKLQDSNRGPAQVVQFLTARRVVAPQTLQFGHPGDTAANVLSRMTPILAAPCGAYVVMIGTNDLGTITTAQLQANISSIWTQLLATGRPVIAQTILPRTLSAGTARDQMWAVNRWIREQNGTLPGLYVVDSSAAYGDPLSSTASPRVGATSDYNYSYDNLHPKGIGALAAFGPVATLFNQIYNDRGQSIANNTDVYSSTNTTGNLLANALMSFTGGTGTVSGRVTGTAPDGWLASSVDNGCSTCTFTGTASSSTLSDGTPAAQMVVAGTASGGYQTQIYFSQALTVFTNFSTGDQLQASCRVEMDAGSAHITSPFLSLTYTSGGVAYTLFSGPAGSLTPLVSDASPSTAYAGTLSTPLPAPALPGGLSGTLSFSIGVFITNGSSATVGGTFRVSACTLRKAQ